MSRHLEFDAELELLNLEFAQSNFGIFGGPFLNHSPVWNMPGNGFMTNAYQNQELNQAIQLSEYLLPSNSPVEDISPLPACLYEQPALVPNLLDIPGFVGADYDAESARFTPGCEMGSEINSACPGIHEEVPTPVPIASGSHTASTQEPIKRGRGRPKGSKTKQRVSLLSNRRNTPTNVYETHFLQHPAKPKTPEAKAQAKLEKAAIRQANKKASQEAKEAERKANAMARRKAQLNAYREIISMDPDAALWE